MATNLWKEAPKPNSISFKSITGDRAGIGLGTGILGVKSYTNDHQVHEKPEMNKKKETNAPVVQTQEQKMEQEIAKLNSLSIKCKKFKDLLEMPNIDFEILRKLSWPGIPDEIRPTVWKLLMGYLPANSDRREATLTRKRKEYEDFVSQAYSRGTQGLDQQLSHQIHIDIQRTNAHIKLYQSPITQESLERVLYIWAIRHPASGYVQGINDLLTPFFQVFLLEYIPENIENNTLELLSKEQLANIEADSYWCLSKLLDGIQDNYTHAQPGITRQIARLKELITRVDGTIH
ncbi:GTPase-activating protein [Boothiomyces macroporosus]|uniref:GTPase-activating protein n=1 Tax=Boothiomyces macroporosus TaxID=261099 RepID=A0AAD5Y0X5_9FUNG|nr:GTPase-activating protein [Boothiomyces macroporosus]